LPVSFDNLSLGHRRLVQWGPLIEADLADGDRLVAVLREHRVTSVIHFAASAYVGDSVRDPAFYYRNNLLTTLTLLGSMRAAGVSNIVFSSSCSVYGNPKRLPIDEAHPLAPLSPYGQTKLDCENAIRWYAAAYSLRAVCLRYFNAAGADPDGQTGEDHDPETRLVPRAIMAAMGALPALEVFGNDYPTADGTAVRDYVHVADLAHAHVAALEHLPEPGRAEVINLGTGRGYSVREVMDVVQRVVGRPVPHILVNRRAGDPSEVVADPQYAKTVLDWSAVHSDLHTIVATAHEWHLQRLAAVSPAP
jgi:UDP-glucose-4-epimerase GalE